MTTPVTPEALTFALASLVSQHLDCTPEGTAVETIATGYGDESFSVQLSNGQAFRIAVESRPSWLNVRTTAPNAIPKCDMVNFTPNTTQPNKEHVNEDG